MESEFPSGRNITLLLMFVFYLVEYHLILCENFFANLLCCVCMCRGSAASCRNQQGKQGVKINRSVPEGMISILICILTVNMIVLFVDATVHHV